MPALGAEARGDEIRYRRNVGVGIAVAESRHEDHTLSGLANHAVDDRLRHVGGRWVVDGAHARERGVFAGRAHARPIVTRGAGAGEDYPAARIQTCCWALAVRTG